MFSIGLRFECASVLVCVGLLGGCSGGDEGDTPAKPSAFALSFAASAEGEEVGCSDSVAKLGPRGDVNIGPSDLRFYVSALRFEDSRGEEVKLELDEDEFQYLSVEGAVSLVDLTSNDEGNCAGSAIAFSEGTERTHAAITGTTLVEQVRAVSFEVGVPQAVMRAVVTNHTEEGAPSPLDEMYWSWATGYRHFVFNFTISNDDDESGEGYVHIGSRDCGPSDGKALEDRDTCGYVNTPKVHLTDFYLTENTVLVDLPALLAGVDFVSPIYDTETFEVIGEGPGVECHSSPMQVDCAALFGSFGLDMESGEADPARGSVFTRH